MKHLFLLLLCLFATAAKATLPTSWQYHLSYFEAIDHVEAAQEIYAVASGNLLCYDRSDQSIRVIDRLSGLSDKGIAHIAYSATQHLVVILYANNNIDLLSTRDGAVLNIPQVKNYTETALTVNDLQVNNDWATLATNQGVVVLNLARREVRGYYNLGQNVVAAAVSDDGREVYAATPSALLCAPLTANLNVVANWAVLRQSPTTGLRPFAGGVYAFFTGGDAYQDKKNRLVYLAAPDADGNRAATTLLNDFTLVPTTVSANEFVMLTRSSVFRATKEEPNKFLPAVRHTVPKFSAVQRITSATSGRLWVSEGVSGLRCYRIDEDSVRLSGDLVPAFGPRRDLCSSIHFDLSPEGQTELLVAGGRYDPFDTNHQPGTLMALTGADTWYTFPGENGEFPGMRYRDVVHALRRPSHPTTVYATLGGSGLLRYENGLAAQQYYNANSPLASAAATSRHYVMTAGMAFDAQENLWILSGLVQTPIQVLHPDTTWTAVPCPPINNHSQLSNAVFDHNGALWITSTTASVQPSGLCCLDYNGTIANTADDRSLFRSSVTNEDGTSVSLTGMATAVVDLTGQLWLGCDAGVLVVPDPSTWFNTDFTILQPKVPRNDGTNYADYLLNGSSITAIAVDAANRKWIATAASGIYLVSPDGTEILEHHTFENSPLLSNIVYDIAIDHHTGRVMVATDAGLCSFLGTATEAQPTLVESNISVYPNPLRPEHPSRLTIAGLTDGADVKIVSAASQLVARGTSTGGSFVWDAQGPRGGRVAPGVYYVLIATSTATEAVAAKFVVM